MSLFYAVDNSPTRFEYQSPCKHFDLKDPLYASILAVECASDYHDDHDGWESSWPIVLMLFETEDGPEVCRFSVDLEARPHFIATPFKAPA